MAVHRATMPTLNMPDPTRRSLLALARSQRRLLLLDEALVKVSEEHSQAADFVVGTFEAFADSANSGAGALTDVLGLDRIARRLCLSLLPQYSQPKVARGS
ncbi:hypothetical protein AK812_SmicGene37311 [Symbiodinium microadriaticum]|uniref:Uncharacterized protein n=1 Tax=Symbiodinium microadriaticum TaxID=2951 RepID=A0A1Q9CGM7_SYMMI|nr:hypothetical protein AK812_SmicGene37311 [Symbiodinium microadriaticum]